MSKHTTVKKSLILLVALLMCVSVLFAACKNNAFKPNFDAPKNGTVDSNGGIAVRYGDWIYYVNGYTSDVSADNDYVDTNDAPRIGSVLRISIAKLAEIFEVYDKDLTSTAKKDAIAKLVEDNAQIVVPKIYYSANTATAQFNGIYIFNDRLYMLTPNDKLTAGGNPQTEQLVLMSFDLNGANPERHFTFTNNAAQVWLYEKGSSVAATYIMDSKLYTLDIQNDEKSVSTEITVEDETVSSIMFDEAAQCLFFLDGDGSLCRLNKGSSEKTVVFDNSVEEGEDASPISYTLKTVNNGYVYYTKSNSDNPNPNGLVLYYVNTNQATDGKYAEVKALDSSNVGTLYGWKDGKIVVIDKDSDSGCYGLYIVTQDIIDDPVIILLHGFNSASITINKIVGDTLYYTASGVNYKKDLTAFLDGDDVVANEEQSESYGEAYAYSMTWTPATGWALTDLVVVTVGDVTHTYMFSLSADTVSVVEFDSVKKSNSTSTSLTLFVEPEEED